MPLAHLGDLPLLILDDLRVQPPSQCREACRVGLVSRLVRGHVGL